MFFLLRLTFWLGLVCLLLPSGSKTADPDAQINATQAVTLASAAVSDARGFCERQPTACKVGGKVAVALGHKAEAGARTLIGFVTSKMGGTGDAGAADDKAGDKAGAGGAVQATGSVSRMAARGPAAKVVTVSSIVPKLDHGTLRPADLKPAFHARVPLPPRRPRPPGRPSV